MTGYTEIVEKGCTFEDFVWRCAKAMSPLMCLRDEPLSTPIPKYITPPLYYRDALDHAERELERVRNMTVAQAEKEAEKEYAAALAMVSECNSDRARLVATYNRMVDKVNAWKPPEHWAKLKTFMLEQLSYETRHSGPVEAPVKQSGIDWLSCAVVRLKRNIASHAEDWKAEQDRAALINLMLSELRDSVPQPKETR